jgi:SNF2 family DNA or RNA helicase
VTTYDGPKNLRPTPEQLCRYNVVLCSYDTLRRDAESDGRITVDGDKTLRRDAEFGDSTADAVMGNASSEGSAGMGREDGDPGVSGGVDGIKAKTQSARGLASVQWWRVVLDEAHLIRNQRSLSFKVCQSLRAQNRWCLTGTPLQVC